MSSGVGTQSVGAFFGAEKGVVQAHDGRAVLEDLRDRARL